MRAQMVSVSMGPILIECDDWGLEAMKDVVRREGIRYGDLKAHEIARAYAHHVVCRQLRVDRQDLLDSSVVTEEFMHLAWVRDMPRFMRAVESWWIDAGPGARTELLERLGGTPGEWGIGLWIDPLSP